MKKVELVFTPDSPYIHNMQSRRGKANIFYKDEPNNPHDPEAVAIYTLNQHKDEIFLGYIKKNNVQTIFTKEANELYEMAQCGEITWEEAKANPKWAEVKEVLKTPICTPVEIEEIKKGIQEGRYRFRYDYYESMGYLFEVIK